VKPSTPRASPDVAVAPPRMVFAPGLPLDALSGVTSLDNKERVSVKATSAAFSAFAVIAPAVKLPEPSRFTIAFAVSALVGATFQAKFRVPAVFTGDPLTVKSDAGADSPTLVTGPVPGKVCPEANVMSPLLLILNPVSAGKAVPVA
jgi:hypothetical protein